MIEEEFLALFKQTKKLIDDANKCRSAIGLGAFMTNWQKYKSTVFADYTEECLDSSSFRDYVFDMMCMQKYLNKFKSSTPAINTNIINFADYKKRAQS